MLVTVLAILNLVITAKLLPLRQSSRHPARSQRGRWARRGALQTKCAGALKRQGCPRKVLRSIPARRPPRPLPGRARWRANPRRRQALRRPNAQPARRPRLRLRSRPAPPARSRPLQDGVGCSARRGPDRRNLFQSSMVQLGAMFAGNAQRAARHCTGGSVRPCERLAVQNQTTTDSSADGDVKDLYERPPGANHCLGPRCRPHVRLDERWGKPG